MKYLLLTLFCFSCVQSPDYQKIVNKTMGFVKHNERIRKVHILREKANQNLKNGKHHKFLTEKELLNQNETFCNLNMGNLKKGVTFIVVNFCSGNHYVYYFSGKDNLDSMKIVQTKKQELNKLDSLCLKRMYKIHPELLHTRKTKVPPFLIENYE